jgi:3-methyladenine DNA glycosylase AlkD
MIAEQIRKNLRKIRDKERAEISQRFFKTGPGEYAEGDLFLGIRVPELRKLAKVYEPVSLTEATRLLWSAIHEERLLALFILIRRYAKGNDIEQKKIYRLYLKNIQYVNNWDLVDASAEHIVGDFLKDKPKKLLYKLAKSKCLWERRIAIVSTFHYIKRAEFSETLKISGMLLEDKEDLIHKAVGWMLREVGKRDLEAEETFLRKYYQIMPRTMLRYAIERFPESKRQRYLKGTV